MKRRGNFSPSIATDGNYELAFRLASNHKRHRHDVIEFGKDLERNLQELKRSFADGSFRSSPYSFMLVHDPKERLIGMLPFPDHLQHWAMLNAIEMYVDRSLSNYTYAGRYGMGTHGFMKSVRKALRSDPSGTYAFLTADVRKFYFCIDHTILKRTVRTKIKDRHLLSIMDGIIDASGEDGVGLWPGSKLSQFLSVWYLSSFDHDIKRCFGILDNPQLVDYYTERYISEKIAHAKPRDYEDLSRGPQYLAEKFRRYLLRIPYYFRLADDVLILHEDTTFLHLVIEWIGLYYGHELHLEMNDRWRVGLTDDGIDVGGYVYRHGYILARKRNKKALCRQVAGLRKEGCDDEQVRLKTASRAGFISHSNHVQLFKKLGIMETKRLGEKMRAKKIRTPWPDLPADRKRKFEDVLFDSRIPRSPEMEQMEEQAKLIELLDYKIENSIIEKNQDGTPKKCLILRYRWNGEEWYSYTGSDVLIDQATNRFTKEDLPAQTVIKISTNKFNKKFYTFT